MQGTHNIINFNQGLRVMEFNATFNNISAISWLSVLLVEETGLPGENHQPGASHLQILSHNVAIPPWVWRYITASTVLVLANSKHALNRFFNPY
jgi:hypothetical protein